MRNVPRKSSLKIDDGDIRKYLTRFFLEISNKLFIFVIEKVKLLNKTIMYFNGRKIKLSFSRAKYQTVGNTVYCTLQYTVNVPGAYSDAIVIVPNEKLTYTVTGKATCNGDDVFNKQLGREIANARAEAKAYKQAQTLMNKQVKEVVKKYYDMVLEFDEKADFIQRHDAEYVAELSK